MLDARRNGDRRWRVPGWGLVAIALIAGGATLVVLHPGLDLPATSARSEQPEFAEESKTGAQENDLEARVHAFCGDCHAVPRPESFPRDAWYREVQRGYEFYAESGRKDLQPPLIEETVAYYRELAPRRLVYPEPRESDRPFAADFREEPFPGVGQDRLPPAISHLRWTSLQPGTPPVLLAGDMRTGTVEAWDLRAPRPVAPRCLARLNHPCRVLPCDLDQDGVIELVVADLGSFLPDDHDRGAIVWLQPDPTTGLYRRTTLAAGLGRVVDVRPADLDGDGDVDLVAAEFGLYRTGGIYILTNVAGRGAKPQFSTRKMDLRHGPIDVPLYDFDRDGRLDLVAVISQEHEAIDLFLNQGQGRMVRRNLWAGPDLTFGLSGLEVVDLDDDDDADLLVTNGDAFDNSYVLPHHGVQWLENCGELQFRHHRLADLAGAYRAVAGDLDLDGDLDIITVAWLPPQILPPELQDAPLSSVICLEQTSAGRFVRHTLKWAAPRHLTLELADFDGDGDLDFAAGYHVLERHEPTPSFAVWWNQVRTRRDPDIR